MSGRLLSHELASHGGSRRVWSIELCSEGMGPTVAPSSDEAQFGRRRKEPAPTTLLRCPPLTAKARQFIGTKASSVCDSSVNRPKVSVSLTTATPYSEKSIMKWFPRFSHVKPTVSRRSVPQLEQMESRQALTVNSSSVAFDLVGREVTDVVFSNGALYQYDYAGADFPSNNVTERERSLRPGWPHSN